MRTALLFLLRAYQSAISPLFPPTCRFVPTCSAYAVEAIQVHGAIKGVALATWRILRCHPFAKGGLDPVPPKRAGITTANSSTGTSHG